MAGAGQGFGKLSELTAAQIMFISLARLEDAQIQAGNGLVKREEIGASDPMDTSQYFKMRRYTHPGTPEYESLVEKAKKQRPFRKLIEKRLEPAMQDFARAH